MIIAMRVFCNCMKEIGDGAVAFRGELFCPECAAKKARDVLATGATGDLRSSAIAVLAAQASASVATQPADTSKN